MTNEQIVKLLVLAGYLGVLLVMGAIASRRMKDLRDYFVAGKRLSFISVAFSARATGESAWLLLGLTGMGAFVGAKALWIVAGELLGVGLAWLVMSRRFKRLTDRYDAVTIPDYLEARFRDSGHLLRLIAAGTLVTFVTIYVSAQIDATGKAFETFAQIPYYYGALIGFAVVLIYIASGGFLAVVWSDVFQGTLMVLGLVTLPILGVLAAGGVDNVLASLRTIDPSLLSLTAGEQLSPLTIASIIGFLGIGLGFLGSPQVFVRFIALRSESEISKGAALALSWTLLADTGAVLTGMVGRALLTGDGGPITLAGQESTLPSLVDFLFTGSLWGPLMAGIFMAVVLSAIMSTIDSLLVVAGSAAVRDYYQKTLHPDLSDASLIRASRWTTVVLAFLGLGVAMLVAMTTEDRTIFWFVIFGWSGIAATFCPTIILSLFWPGMTSMAAKCAMVVGFLCVPLFKFGPPKLMQLAEESEQVFLRDLGQFFVNTEELAPAFAMSFLTAIVISLIDTRGRRRMDVTGSELREAAD